jgi:hypothetical protein
MDRSLVPRRRVLNKAGALAALGAAAALTGPHMVQASDESPETIVGTWLETINPTGNAAPSFQALTLYAADGGWTSTASTDLTPATLASSAYGAWIHKGERAFRWFAHAFAYTPQGSPNGFYTIQEDLQLDRNAQAYSGSGSFEIVNNGKVLVAARFTSIAARVSVPIY